MSRIAVSRNQPKSPARACWWRYPALYAALMLFTADALLLEQGLLAALLLMTVFGWLVPKALLLSKVRRDAWPTLRLALLFGATAVAIMATINLNNHLARQRAARLIEAIDLYHASQGRYPLALDALVPRYIAAVPRAKYTLAFNQFIYRQQAPRARLAYVEVPPLARPCFDFEQRRWLGAERAGAAQPSCDRAFMVAEQEPMR